VEEEEQYRVPSSRSEGACVGVEEVRGRESSEAPRRTGASTAPQRTASELTRLR